MVNKLSANKAYFRKVGHAWGMKRKGHVLVHLGQFKDENPVFVVLKCKKKNQKGHFVRILHETDV